MIKEVLGLGIKGEDIVLSTLKKVEEQKNKFLSMSQMDLGEFSKSESKLIQKLIQQNKPKTLEQELKSLTEKEDKRLQDAKKNEFNKYASSPLGAVQGVSTLQAGAASKAIMEGIAGGVTLLNPVAGAIAMAAAKVGGSIIDAAHTFKDQVKSAAMTVADSEDARNRVLNIMGKGNEGFLRNQRVDINVNSQRAIAEALGDKFGIVGEHMRKSVERLYGDNKRATDVKQATAIATGNFAALGTNQGFFMQKIADSFSGLPPTVKQELIAQMQDSIPTEGMWEQTDKGIRGAVTQIDNMERDRATKMVGYDEKTKRYTNIDMAIDLQKTINEIDVALNNGMGKLIESIEVVAKKIRSWGDHEPAAGRPRRATN